MSAAPYVWPPSGHFDGDVGKWSTFPLAVGGQTFRMIISTSLPVTIIPKTSDLCNNQTDTAGCEQARGFEAFDGAQSRGFEENSSSTWEAIGPGNLYLSFRSETNSTIQTAEWGRDRVQIGGPDGNGPALKNSTVATTDNEIEEFFTGLFGLDKTLIVVPHGDPVRTDMSILRDNNLIPSSSYGYTAGAAYANDNQGMNGSLVLGGYDASRLNPSQQITVQMNSIDNTPRLIVGVRAIEIINGSEISNAASTFDKFYCVIDSSTPYLWIPSPYYEGIPNLFNLTLNNQTGFFETSSVARQSNSGKSLRFTVTPNLAGDTRASAEITIPYAGLELNATYPAVVNQTNIFPLRSPASDCILGRPFLQHAYIVVDHERQNYTVAQAVVTSSMPSPSIVSISRPPPETSSPASPNSRLSAGAIAGIVVACIAVLVALGMGLFFLIRRKKRTSRQGSKAPGTDLTAVSEGQEKKVLAELQTGQAAELHGDPRRSEIYGSPLSEMGAKLTPVAELEANPLHKK